MIIAGITQIISKHNHLIMFRLSPSGVYVNVLYREMEVSTVPHGVENGAILHDAEEFVRGRHVVSY